MRNIQIESYDTSQNPSRMKSTIPILGKNSNHYLEILHGAAGSLLLKAVGAVVGFLFSLELARQLGPAKEFSESEIAEYQSILDNPNLFRKCWDFYKSQKTQ